MVVLVASDFVYVLLNLHAGYTAELVENLVMAIIIQRLGWNCYRKLQSAELLQLQFFVTVTFTL
jgi:ABC-type Co2+ transport system permease subunit